MSLDRLISVLYLRWKTFFTTKKAVAACILCSVVFVLINTGLIIPLTETVKTNGTSLYFVSVLGFLSWVNTYGIVSEP